MGWGFGAQRQGDEFVAHIRFLSGSEEGK